MSYILANVEQKKIISKLRKVLTEKNLKGMQTSHADRKTPSYLEKCKKAKVNPNSENTVIAWHHITYRYLRGLV